MKYIDAEKLIAEIERRFSEYNHDSNHHIQAAECASILDFIDTLNTTTSPQQEQPECICHRCVWCNKTDDVCEYPYGGRNCHINKNGVYECNGFEEVEQPEQPEVDLEKDIEKICDFNKAQTLVTLTKGGLRAAAYHFYELGLKAGKEEK